jgi:hypothetical protein
MVKEFRLALDKHAVEDSSPKSLKLKDDTPISYKTYLTQINECKSLTEARQLRNQIVKEINRNNRDIGFCYSDDANQVNQIMYSGKR